MAKEPALTPKKLFRSSPWGFRTSNPRHSRLTAALTYPLFLTACSSAPPGIADPVPLPPAAPPLAGGPSVSQNGSSTIGGASAAMDGSAGSGPVAPVSGSEPQTPSTTCLSDDVVHADLASATSHDALRGLADKYVSACPESSKAWLFRAKILQQGGWNAAEVQRSAQQALSLDADWDRLTPSDANRILAIASLHIHDHLLAQTVAAKCRTDSASCAAVHKVTVVPQKAPATSNAGDGESAGGQCPAPKTSTHNPAYGLSLLAQGHLSLGLTAEANRAAKDCLIWGKTGLPPAAPADSPGNFGEEIDGLCLRTVYTPPASATLVECQRVLDLTAQVAVGASTKSVPGKVEADATIAFGMYSGVAYGSANASYTVYRVYDTQGNSGTLVTIAGAAGNSAGAGWFVGGGVQVTSASTIYDLAGPSSSIGDAWLADGLGAGFDVFAGIATPYWGVDLYGGFGLGGDASLLSGGWSFLYPDGATW